MHDQLIHRIWRTAGLIMLLAVAGCFQPAGGSLEATNPAQALPSFTPYPSDTPIPVPSDTPTELFIQPTETQVPTFEIIQIEGTQVAQVQEEQVEPMWQTATAIYLLSQGQQPIEVQPIPQDVATLDPLLASATVMVEQATMTAAAPMTQTAQAIFGFPSPTPIFILPTNTFVGPIPSGSDCVYEVQPDDANLYRISLKFGIPYMSIAQSTHLVNPNLIHVGDRLIVPGCGVTGYIPPPTSTPGAGGYLTPVPGGNNGTYVVQQGDTLFALSLAWGTTVNAIAQLNQIPNINLIYIGQTLYIP